ncbi:AraC family transcriptional regulator [Pseudomonas sp. CAH-1]|nr:AraC family transcriptional regulator [Pseudomonas sp. CAH-1]
MRRRRPPWLPSGKRQAASGKRQAASYKLQATS